MHRSFKFKKKLTEGILKSLKLLVKTSKSTGS